MNVARGAGGTPPTMTAAARVLAGVSVAHLAIVLATLTRRPQLRDEVAAQHPGAPLTTIDALVDQSVVLTVAVHLPLLVLTAFLAYRLPGGHPWVVRPTTVSQALSIIFAYPGTPPFTDLQTLMPLLIAAEATVLMLIWLPRRSRTFIRTHTRTTRPTPSTT